MENELAYHKHPRWKRKGQIRKWLFLLLSALYLSFVVCILVLRASTAEYEKKTSREVHIQRHRLYRRNADVTGGVTEEVTELGEEKLENCTPRAVNEFPANFLSLKDTQDGGVAAHIVIALYMFGALAIVCDDYFVPSLEMISERLHLQEDVAGATFMAAGSSAPEFFTSVIGVFIAKSDVGVGTIVGSAVFNILFIIGACAMFAGMVVDLTWWPMMRDSMVYLISIVALVIVIQDDEVYWYEAAILVVLYILYIVIMYFNRTLERKARRIVYDFKKKRARDYEPLEDSEKQPLSKEHQKENGTFENTDLGSKDIETSFCKDASGSQSTSISDEDYESPWKLPDNLPMIIYWITMLPIKLLMYITVPDCRRPGCYRNLYPLTFIMSIVWIAACSYLMVWMVTIAGDALEIPDTVMGLTLLAAGTSVPDCLSSIFVARDGFGDMAVSNSIGSNVFDILICLGFPWLLETAIVNSGQSLVIHSGGIIYSALTLLSTVVFMIVAINVAKWKLTKPFGILCFVVYAVVIALSCLYELNIFGDFVAPSCPR